MSVKNIVITGASVGIGAAAARRFSKDPCHIVLLARRLDKLEALQQELGKDKVSIFELDVTDLSKVQEMFAHIEKKFGAIDVLVNNAGGAFGDERAYEANVEEWEKCIDVNIKGLMYCVHSALPGMVGRNRGHIINLGSISGSYPYIGGNAYCGAKAFVHQFSLCLRSDLLGTHVRVSCIEPGSTSGTEFSKVRFRGDMEKANSVYKDIKPLKPEDVAEVIYFCASLPEYVNINTVEMMPVCQATSVLSVHRG